VVIEAVPPGAKRLAISAALSASRVAVGDRVAISGSVDPATVVAGTPVALARLINGRYVTVRTTTVASDGKYRFSFIATRAGTFDYRVIHEAAGCTDLGCVYRRSNSGARLLTVR
jgi:hypothetical protein